MLVDTHAHLEAVDDFEEALKRAKKAGVNKLISIGTNLEESKNAIRLAEKYSKDGQQVFATCGIHPNDGKRNVNNNGLEETIKKLRLIARASKKVIAIGECGLDYYDSTREEQKKIQRELFIEQIKLASELKLPLVVHCRNGWDEIFDVISNIQIPNSKLTGVFHSWTGDLDAMQRALELGFYISFSGILTFKNALAIQEVAKKAPLDRIIIETDSPYLAPEPIRGQKNESGNVRIIAEFLSQLRNTSFDDISFQTSENAQILFNLL